MICSERNYCSDQSAESFGKIACCCITKLGVDAGASPNLALLASTLLISSHLISPEALSDLRSKI